MEILYILIGLILGAVIAYFYVRSQQASLEVQMSELNIKNQSLESDNGEIKAVLKEKEQSIENFYKEINSLSTKNATLMSDLKNSMDKEAELDEELVDAKSELEIKINLVAKLEKQIIEFESKIKHTEEKQVRFKEEMEEMHKKMKLQFETFSNKLMEENSSKFTKQNEENISKILNPLTTNIKEFEKRIQETYNVDAKERVGLKTEIKHLMELNKQISDEANNLAKALKGDSKTQGTWGEFVLEKVLDNSGLEKGREYFIQETLKNDEGKMLRPDVVVKYPGEKNIIIDSKVSLNAYERYVNADSKDEKESSWKSHLLAMKNHIDQLSAKKYEDLYGINGLDFVFMFVPIEPAFIETLHDRDGIWQYAYDKKVLMISPTNLVSALKLIYNLWQQEHQTRNVLEIAKQAGGLHDKFVGLLEDLLTIGKKIDDTRLVYESSMNKLREGKGNLLSRVDKLKDLGAKVKKEIPRELVQEN
jgi:DNA recombination protein RmuC